MFGLLISYLDKKEGERIFNQATISRAAKWRQESKEDDFYYRPSPNGFGYPDYNFYSDGSLKLDICTGKSYPKGMYYCRSDGYMVNNKKADSNMKRPPKD